MSQIVTISSIYGTPPFQVYLCDSRLTTCILSTTIGGINELPVSVNLPTILINVNDLIIKIIDGNNCQSFQKYGCITPTPSVTPTATPV